MLYAPSLAHALMCCHALIRCACIPHTHALCACFDMLYACFTHSLLTLYSRFMLNARSVHALLITYARYALLLYALHCWTYTAELKHALALARFSYSERCTDALLALLTSRLMCACFCTLYACFIHPLLSLYSRFTHALLMLYSCFSAQASCWLVWGRAPRPPSSLPRSHTQVLRV